MHSQRAENDRKLATSMITMQVLFHSLIAVRCHYIRCLNMDPAGQAEATACTKYILYSLNTEVTKYDQIHENGSLYHGFLNMSVESTCGTSCRREMHGM